MKISKIEGSNKYEAISTVNNGGVVVFSGSVVPIEFIGFGDTFSEAINACLGKVFKFLAPPKSEFQKQMDGAVDTYTEEKDKQFKNNG